MHHCRAAEFTFQKSQSLGNDKQYYDRWIHTGHLDVSKGFNEDEHIQSSSKANSHNVLRVSTKRHGRHGCHGDHVEDDECFTEDIPPET